MNDRDARRLAGRLRRFIDRFGFHLHAERDDLVQIGLTAAQAAEARFDSTTGIPDWVWRAIRAEGAIKDAVRPSKAKNPKRPPVVSYDEMEALSREGLRTSPSAEQEFFRTIYVMERMEAMLDDLREFDGRLAFVAIQRIFHGTPPGEIAECLDCSPSRVSQLLNDLRRYVRVWEAAH